MAPRASHDNSLPFAQQEERSPVRKGDRGNGPKAPSSRVMGNGGAGGGAHGGRGGGLSMSHGPRSHFAFQATTFMTGEKPWRQILHYSYASVQINVFVGGNEPLFLVAKSLYKQPEHRCRLQARVDAHERAAVTSRGWVADGRPRCLQAAFDGI